jgi:hypothetical protein
LLSLAERDFGRLSDSSRRNLNGLVLLANIRPFFGDVTGVIEGRGRIIFRVVRVKQNLAGSENFGPIVSRGHGPADPGEGPGQRF